MKNKKWSFNVISDISGVDLIKKTTPKFEMDNRAEHENRIKNLAALILIWGFSRFHFKKVW